ncbi:hypothetical protein ACS52_11450 [Bacillus cereus]|nr:hypothetical protein ACS52_11450 [Bacillus cereus]
MTALTHGATTERRRLKEVMGLIILWGLLPGTTECGTTLKMKRSEYRSLRLFDSAEDKTEPRDGL